MDLPIAQDVIRTVESARGSVVALPTMGGGLPLQDVERPTGARTIIIPMGNHDNNQHSANENIRLENLWDGIEVYAGLLADLVSRAAPDGYTLLVTGGAHWIGPLLEKVSYDPIADFATISLLGTTCLPSKWPQRLG